MDAQTWSNRRQRWIKRNWQIATHCQPVPVFGGWGGEQGKGEHCCCQCNSCRCNSCGCNSCRCNSCRCNSCRYNSYSRCNSCMQNIAKLKLLTLCGHTKKTANVNKHCSIKKCTACDKPAVSLFASLPTINPWIPKWNIRYMVNNWKRQWQCQYIFFSTAQTIVLNNRHNI